MTRFVLPRRAAPRHRVYAATLMLSLLAAPANVVADSAAPETSTSKTSAPARDTLVRAARPLDHLGTNLKRTVTGWPLALHLAGGASTAALVSTGTDAHVLRAASRHDRVANALITGPGLMTGTLAPVLLPTSLYVFADDEGWKSTGAVGMQAVGISFLYNNILKSVTGRPPPDASRADRRAHAQEFRFGFLRGGVFHGWPSGHTMVNTALATSLASYHRDTPWALPAALAYSGYIGTSMVLGNRGEIHWLTDATAGFLMGAGIGWVVGDSYYRARKDAGPAGHRTQEASPPRSWLGDWSLVPVWGSGQGLLAVKHF